MDNHVFDKVEDIKKTATVAYRLNCGIVGMSPITHYFNGSGLEVAMATEYAVVEFEEPREWDSVILSGYDNVWSK